MNKKSKLLALRMVLVVGFILFWTAPTHAERDSLIINLNISQATVDWCNLQWPGSGSFQVGQSFIVYAQVYEAGLTDQAGQATQIQAWIGYSTNNSDPSGSDWIWVPATYNQDVGNNDEYMVNLDTVITTEGTYFVASRFSLDGATFQYGGYSAGGGGFWDGVNYVSAVYTVTMNHPPVLSDIPDQVLTEDTPHSITLSATDSDGDSVSYSVEGGSATTVAASLQGTTLTLTPAANYNTATPLIFVVTASDGRGGVDADTFQVTVTPVNDAPVIQPIGDQQGVEGQELSFTLTATDVDGDSLTWTAQNLPSGATFTDNHDGTATFTWTPGYDQAGTYSGILFIVDDGQGGTVLVRMQQPPPTLPLRSKR